MMKVLCERSALALLLLTPVSSLAAQENEIPVRTFSEAVARSTVPFTSISGLRALPDGRVYVNDAQRRQILLLDSELAIARVIADTAAGSVLQYGQRFGLLPYVSDSTLIVDPSTLSILVLNAQGDLVRVMAAPRTSDINLLASLRSGSHAFDSRGRLIYAPASGGAMGGMAGGPMGGFGGGGSVGGGSGGGGFGGGAMRGAANANAGGGPANAAGRTFTPRAEGRNSSSAPSDSQPILRADLDSRSIDTVAFIRVANSQITTRRTEEGGMQVSVKMNPLPQNDDWALMSDGTLAVVRVLDYRVDWFGADGSFSKSEPLPFDWMRISDEDKTRIIDSLKLAAEQASQRAEQLVSGPRGFRPSFEPVEPENLPDYYPPIRAGSTMADHEGNLWILPATSSLSVMPVGPMGAGPGTGGRGRPPAESAAPSSGLIYDVVNRSGKLTERFRLPPGRTLLGFVPGGGVLLQVREGREVRLELFRR